MTEASIKNDRFSELNEDLIHLIMSKLSDLDATRMSTLSKRFFSLWLSFPVIDLDFSVFNGTPQDFYGFVRRSLRRDPQALVPERLTASYFPLFIADIKLTREIVQFCLDLPIKHLHLLCGCGGCSFPTSLFSADHIKTLELESFNLEPRHLVLNCPSIEDFDLSDCWGLQSIEISSSVKLIHTIRLHHCKGLESVHVNLTGTTLGSFSCVFAKKTRCDINLSLASRKSLKFLDLRHVGVPENWFNEYVPQFVSLEILKLKYCGPLRNMSIGTNNHHLKSLVLRKCDPIENIVIAAPNLESFRYRGISYIYRPEISIRGCTFVKNLYMTNLCITNEWIQENICGLQFLEDLKFAYSRFVFDEPIKFASLTSLKLIFCHIAEEIEAPYLESFTNKWSLQPNSSPPLLLTSPNFDKVYLQLDGNLMDFICCFGHCNTLFMFLTETTLEELAISKQQRSTIMTSTPVLHAVNHLVITTQFWKFSSFVELVDTLLWLAPHPETIYIDDVSRPGTEPRLSKIKLHYGTSASGSKEEAEDCETCRTLLPTAKCWRHCLTEVTLEDFNKFIHSKLHDFFMENASQLAKITVI